MAKKKAAPKHRKAHPKAHAAPEEEADVVNVTMSPEEQEDIHTELDEGVVPTELEEEAPGPTPAKVPTAQDLSLPHPMPPTTPSRTKPASPGGSAAFVAPLTEERRRFLLHHLPTLEAPAQLSDEAQLLVAEGLVALERGKPVLTDAGIKVRDAL